MTDRYTTAGYIIIGAVTTIAIPLMIVVALNRSEPWALDLAFTIAAAIVIAVAVAVALAIASIATEHRRLR